MLWIQAPDHYRNSLLSHYFQLDEEFKMPKISSGTSAQMGLHLSGKNPGNYNCSEVLLSSHSMLVKAQTWLHLIPSLAFWQVRQELKKGPLLSLPDHLPHCSAYKPHCLFCCKDCLNLVFGRENVHKDHSSSSHQLHQKDTFFVSCRGSESCHIDSSSGQSLEFCIYLYNKGFAANSCSRTVL